MSPLFFQPPPHGEAESDAHDALIAAGFGYTCRYLSRGPVTARYYWAKRGAYRTRHHRALRAVVAQLRADGLL